MNVSHLRGCRCAFGPEETFDVVRFFCSFPMVVLLRNFLRRSMPFIRWSRVSIFFSHFLFTPNMLLIFLFFSRLFVASCVNFICPYGSRRSLCVPLFFFLLSILGVVLLLLTAKKFIYPSLPIFFCFIYFACLRISLAWSVCSPEQRRSRSHKFSHISSGLCLLSTWRPFFPPISIVPCSRSNCSLAHRS